MLVPAATGGAAAAFDGHARPPAWPGSGTTQAKVCGHIGVASCTGAVRIAGPELGGMLTVELETCASANGHGERTKS